MYNNKKNVTNIGPSMETSVGAKELHNRIIQSMDSCGFNPENFKGMSALQLEQIHLGFLSGIDAHEYAHKHWSPFRMAIARMAILNGSSFDFMRLEEYDDAVFRELVCVACKGMSVEEILQPSLTTAQIINLKCAAELGLPLADMRGMCATDIMNHVADTFGRGSATTERFLKMVLSHY